MPRDMLFRQAAELALQQGQGAQGADPRSPLRLLQGHVHTGPARHHHGAADTGTWPLL